MAEKKSKIPSLEELGKYVGKLFSDIKVSVKEIVNDYQESHPGEDKSVVEETADKQETSEKKETSKAKKSTKKKTAAKKSKSKEAPEEKKS